MIYLDLQCITQEKEALAAAEKTEPETGALPDASGTSEGQEEMKESSTGALPDASGTAEVQEEANESLTDDIEKSDKKTISVGLLIILCSVGATIFLGIITIICVCCKKAQMRKSELQKVIPVEKTAEQQDPPGLPGFSSQRNNDDDDQEKPD